MQVPAAIESKTQVDEKLTTNVQLENNSPIRDDVDDQSGRMVIYNLDSGKCVEAEMGPEQPKINAEEPEIVSEAIEEMILDSIKDQVVEHRDEKKPQVIEDLYAEVKKPTKKTKNAVEEAHLKKDTKDERSDSPLWTYTLPAPPHFADGNNNNLLMVATGKGPTGTGAVVSQAAVATAAAPTETYNSNVYYNYTEIDDGDSIAQQSMTTTVVSDVLITPVIKERIPMLEQQPLMLPLDDDDEEHFNNNHSESSDFNSSSTLTSAASPNILDEERRKKLIINSDIEDGYHGVPMDRMMIVNQGLIDTLEKRREKFIENELEQLVKEEEDKEKGQDINSNVEREVINLFEGESRTLKSTAISAENQEPTISASPVEDGLPRTDDFLRQDIRRGDSFNSSNIGDSTSGDDSKNESLEMQVAPQIDLASQSFEQRRNSFLAELESSKNLFNRRTSNELSISEAPSALQSIQVMRSIMMNTPRKEEPEDAAVAVSLPVNLEIVKDPETVANPKPAPVVVEEPKPWKYTGPPKINLGSWSERPKIQVCLKTDSDYHHSLEQQQQRRRDEETNTQNGPSAVVEEKLPIVRAMELKKTVSVPDDVTLTVVPKAEPIVVAKMQRPMSMHSTKFTPTVRGFLAATKTREGDDEVRSTRINPILMRSNSNVVAKANGGIPMKSPPVTPEKPAIFSQATLRRTGLKDRILAQPEDSVPKREEEKLVKTAEPQLKIPLKSVVVAAAEKSQLTEVVSSPVSPPPPPPPAPPKLMPVKPPGALLNPLARLAAVEPKVAQKPIVRGVVAKKPVTPEDTRSELLDSIRNFNFNHLRKM